MIFEQSLECRSLFLLIYLLDTRSVATAGFYASVFANYDTNSTKSTEQSLWNTSSNVIADNGNITFNAGNDMLQEGSNVFAQNGTATYDIGNDLILRAIADTFFSETKSENLSGGVSVGNNAVQINIGAGESTSRTRSTTYNNSQTIAKNILINTGNNATFSGANILAQKNENGNGGNLTMNIGNNLTIESLQDTYYSKGNSWSASLGIGIGTGDMGPALRGATSKPGQSNKGNNSGNIGFSVGRDRTDSSWVNNQTSLIGNNSVSVNVGTREGSEGKTTITGAIIASGQYETITNSDGTQSSIFVDNNNLNLNTKDLIYTDLNDFYISESKGFGMSTGGGTTSDSGKQTLAPSGSTTVNLKNTGEEREQITKTTIGNGSINVTNTINGEKVIVTELKDENGNVLLDDNGKPKTVNNIDELLIGLNRNVNTSQEITKDQITGALDGSFTVDNRILTSKGRASIAKDFTNLPANFVRATAGAVNTAINPFVTAYQVSTNKDIKLTEVVDQWRGNATAGVNMIKLDRNVINNLSEGKDINEIQKATNNDKVNIYYNENEVDEKNNKIAGKYDHDATGNQSNIHLNAANDTVTNTEKFVDTYGHESSHPFTKNENIANNSGSYAGGMYGLLNTVSGQTINTSGSATSQSWLNSQLGNTSSATKLLNNTIAANMVKNQSNLTIYIEGTNLPLKRGEKGYEKSKEHSLEMAKLAAETYGDKSGNIDFVFWNGGNTQEDRTAAAYQLLNIINNYDFAEGEPLNIVAHSHGGNVIKQFTNIYDLPRLLTVFDEAAGTNIADQSYMPSLINYKTVDGAGLIGTPHVDGYKFNQNVMTDGKLPIAVNDRWDILTQDIMGGTNTPRIIDFIPLVYPTTFANPSKIMEGALNIQIEQLKDRSIFKMTTTPIDFINWGITGNRPQQSIGIIKSHTGLNTPEGWKKYIDPAIRNINNK